MTDGRMRGPIVQAIRETASDPLTQEFVTELLYEEAEHKGQWRWKETYREKIKEFADRRLDENADE